MSRLEWVLTLGILILFGVLYLWSGSAGDDE